jgi:hypothetical protein
MWRHFLPSFLKTFLLLTDKQKRMFSDHFAKFKKAQADLEKAERKKRKLESVYNDFTSPLTSTRQKNRDTTDTSYTDTDSIDSRDKDVNMLDASTGAMHEISMLLKQKRLDQEVLSTNNAQLPIKDRVELLKYLVSFVSEDKKKECIDELCALAGL